MGNLRPLKAVMPPYPSTTTTMEEKIRKCCLWCNGTPHPQQFQDLCSTKCSREIHFKIGYIFGIFLNLMYEGLKIHEPNKLANKTLTTMCLKKIITKSEGCVISNFMRQYSPITLFGPLKNIKSLAK